VLTSGTATTAFEGSSLMNKMIKKAGGKIIVMPSGKITNKNLEEIQRLIPAPEYHGRLIVGPVDKYG
jgi:copper homeostasis protein